MIFERDIMKKEVYICLLVFCSALMFGCVSKQQMEDIDSRLLSLETQGSSNTTTYSQVSTHIESLESQLHNIKQSLELVEKQFREQYAGLKTNSNTTRHEIRQVTGRLEEIEYHLKQKIHQLIQQKQASSKNELPVENIISRIQRIEEYLGLQEKSMPTATDQTISQEKTTVSPSSPQTPEDEMYTMAKSTFDQKDFKTARLQFVKFIKKYPKSKHADNAQFWMGEIYYQEKWFEKAILEYQKVIETYPNGNKVPAALLKQGHSFLELKDKTNASLILKELTKKYPESPEAKLALKKLEQL